jgi:hypothetical protein
MIFSSSERYLACNLKVLCVVNMSWGCILMNFNTLGCILHVILKVLVCGRYELGMYVREFEQFWEVFGM